MVPSLLFLLLLLLRGRRLSRQRKGKVLFPSEVDRPADKKALEVPGLLELPVTLAGKVSIDLLIQLWGTSFGRDVGVAHCRDDEGKSVRYGLTGDARNSIQRSLVIRQGR